MSGADYIEEVPFNFIREARTQETSLENNKIQ